MNIFYLDCSPKLCAEYHVDKHVVKMILEYAQLLSTAHRMLDGVEEKVQYTPITYEKYLTEFYGHPTVPGVMHADFSVRIKPGKTRTRKDMTLYRKNIYADAVLYRHTHVHHPCARWVMESSENYLWLYKLLKCLMKEYTFRYGKIHATARLKPFLSNPPDNISKNRKFTHPPKAMDEQYKCKDTVLSYRVYYNEGKTRMLKWTNRPKPHFIYAV